MSVEPKSKTRALPLFTPFHQTQPAMVTSPTPASTPVGSARWPEAPSSASAFEPALRPSPQEAPPTSVPLRWRPPTSRAVVPWPSSSGRLSSSGAPRSTVEVAEVDSTALAPSSARTWYCHRPCDTALSVQVGRPPAFTRVSSV